MMIARSIFSAFVLIMLFSLNARAFTDGGFIIGKVYNKETAEPIELVSIFLTDNATGAVTDSAGVFTIGPLPAGEYILNASHVSYQDVFLLTVMVKADETTQIEIAMDPTSNTLDEIKVRVAPFKTGIEVPATLHSMLATEIQRNPGSDNDISKVVRALPGVTSISAFRNDLIIRGGAPNENRFFLDGVEIPVINHLVTQGASGGAYSIINSNQLREIDYMSSSFPANRGNALSSVFDFFLKNNETDELKGSVWLGGTEAGVSLEAPLGEKADMLLSTRRSYRQYILKLLDFAFLPVYNDITAKVNINLNKKSRLTLLGIGAKDNFTLNDDLGNNEIQRYLWDNLPVSNQSNYTVGAVYNYFGENATWTLVGSRSALDNSATKYANNDASNQDDLLLNFTSGEYSNRARLEYAYLKKGYKLTLGAGMEDLSGNYDVFNRIFNRDGAVTVDYESNLRFQQYSIFGEMVKSWKSDRITLSLGGRADGNNYNTLMRNPLDQLSGRVNLALGITESLKFNVGTANYYQLPPMMTLSYSNSRNLDNQDVAQYIRSNHYTAGFRWETKIRSRLSVEGFFKSYPEYMMTLRDSISLAHQPVDFGVYGNFPVEFSSEGRAYGVELFYQQKLFRGMYGMITYTLSRSEYRDKDLNFVPAAWDARHITNMTFGKRFNEKWEVGINWRYQSALPFTPFDLDISSRRGAWDLNNQGIRDFSLLNTQRGKSTSIISARVDRIYKFPKWTLNVFLDFENITADADSQQVLILDREMDSNGNLVDEGTIINPGDPYEQQNYLLQYIENAQGAFIPTFGFIIKF